MKEEYRKVGVPMLPVVRGEAETRRQILDTALTLFRERGFEETTIDMYSAVRNGYLQRRYNLIHAE